MINLKCINDHFQKLENQKKKLNRKCQKAWEWDRTNQHFHPWNYIEWMVAGCCQTWIEHPTQSDQARPRSDLHPHIFATEAHWRGTAHGLAALPSVLSVGSRHWSVNRRLIPRANHVFGGFGHCSNGLQQQVLLELYCAKLSELRSVPCHPAIGSCSTIVGWNEHGSWMSGKIVRWQSVFFGKWINMGGFQSSLEPKTASGNLWPKRVTRRDRLQNSNLNPHTLPCPPNWSKSPSKHHSKWLQKLGFSALSHNLSQAAATSMLQVAQTKQSLKHRHHSIMVHRSNRGLHRGGASATTPGEGIKKLQTRNFQEISWDC